MFNQVYTKNYAVNNRKGKAIFYIRLQKAVYGLLKSALLFYKKLLTDLLVGGFELSLHCKQDGGWDTMTITWHVDDLKVSHKKPKRIDELDEYLNVINGKITIKRGKVHDYLGICMDYSEPGKVKMNK